MKGSTKKRGSTWTAYWWVSNTEGKQVQRSKGGFRLQKEAQAHLTTVLAALGDGTYSEVLNKKITVAQFLREHWLPAARTGSTKSGTPRRSSTLKQYEIAVESWLIPHIGGVRLVALTPQQIVNAMTALEDGGGKGGKPLSGRSRQLAHGVLKQALDWGVKTGYVQRNVAALVDRPGATTKKMTCWDEVEVGAFLRSVESDRLYAAWVLFLVLGPRRGEVAGLRWQDVDLAAKEPTLRIVNTRVSIGGPVEESEPKTAAGRRTVPLSPDLVRVLKEHRKRQIADRLKAGPAWTETGYVFVDDRGRPLHPEGISDRWEVLGRKAGLPVIRLHDTRHTAASIMLKHGVPVKVVSEILGHANTKITLSIYAHVMPGMGMDAVTKTSALYSLPG